MLSPVPGKDVIIILTKERERESKDTAHIIAK